MTNDKFNQLRDIGIFKLDKDAYVCSCKTVDIFGDESEQTLVIMTDNRDKVVIDMTVEKFLSLDQILTIEKSKYALDRVDVQRTFDRFEYGIGKYEKIRVKDPLRNTMIEIDPKTLKDHFFYNSRPTKTRIVFEKYDNRIRE
jgi:hypothetical protein